MRWIVWIFICKLFLGELSYDAFFRRLDWSPCGRILIVPAGLRTPPGDTKVLSESLWRQCKFLIFIRLTRFLCVFEGAFGSFVFFRGNLQQPIMFLSTLFIIFI